MDNDLPDGGTPPEGVEDASPSTSTTAEPPGSESPSPDPTPDVITETPVANRGTPRHRSGPLSSLPAAGDGDTGARGRCAGGSGTGRGSHHRRGAGQRQATTPPGDRHRQPEGWRGQDHHRRQPRRLPGRARLPHPGGRPRSAGQRLHRPGDQHPGARGVDVRRPPGETPIEDCIEAQLGAEPVRRSGQPRSGRRRDRAGPGLQSGAPAQASARRGAGRLRLRPHRLSPVAGPAHRQRPSPPPPRCWCRSSASTTPWRASVSSCATSTWCSAT